jgi:hypothetical protein
MEPANRRYADPLDGKLPGMAKGSPITLIGYWEDDSEPGWPSVTDFVDERWDQTERDLVASYLEEGYVPWARRQVFPGAGCAGRRTVRPSAQMAYTYGQQALLTTFASMAYGHR